jgi:hypothetical protein
MGIPYPGIPRAAINARSIKRFPDPRAGRSFAFVHRDYRGVLAPGGRASENLQGLFHTGPMMGRSRRSLQAIRRGHR